MAGRAAYKVLRIQNSTDETTVKATAGVLQRIVLSNGGASARTVTIKNAAATLTVLNLAASDSEVFDLQIPFSTSLKITNSHAEVDTLVVYS